MTNGVAHVKVSVGVALLVGCKGEIAFDFPVGAVCKKAKSIMKNSPVAAPIRLLGKGIGFLKKKLF